MAFAEDLTAFFADFATTATLDGADVTAIVDSATVGEFGDGVLTTAPTALLASAQAEAAAAGQAFSAGAIDYVVRQVLREPPDGALTRLVLVRD